MSKKSLHNSRPPCAAISPQDTLSGKQFELFTTIQKPNAISKTPWREATHFCSAVNRCYHRMSVGDRVL